MRPECIFQQRHQRLHQVRAPSTFQNTYRHCGVLEPLAYHQEHTRPCHMPLSNLRSICLTCRRDFTRSYQRNQKPKPYVMCVVPRYTISCSYPVQIQRLLVPWVRRTRCGRVGAVERQLFPGEHHHRRYRDAQDHGCRWHRVHRQLVRGCCDDPIR